MKKKIFFNVCDAEVFTASDRSQVRPSSFMSETSEEKTLDITGQLNILDINIIHIILTQIWMLLMVLTSNKFTRFKHLELSGQKCAQFKEKKSNILWLKTFHIKFKFLVLLRTTFDLIFWWWFHIFYYTLSKSRVCGEKGWGFSLFNVSGNVQKKNKKLK